MITIMDLVTRKVDLRDLSAEETGTQVQVAFCEALEHEGLLDAVDVHQAGLPSRRTLRR